jgi:hypothetical protein
MVHRIPNPDRAKTQYHQRKQWRFPVPLLKDGRRPQAPKISVDRLIPPESLETSEQLLNHHGQTNTSSAFDTVGSQRGSHTRNEFLTSVERDL